MTKKAKLVTPKGICIWGGNITTEDEYNGKATGAYKLPMVLDPSEPAVAKWQKDTQKEIDSRIDTYLDDLESTDPKAFKVQSKFERNYPWKPQLDDQGDETGLIIVTFKRKVVKDAPKLVDAKRTEMPVSTKVFGGAQVRVAYAFGRAYGMATSKITGVPVYMNVVQCITLGGDQGGGVDDFDEEEGYEYDEDSVVVDQTTADEEDDYGDEF